MYVSQTFKNSVPTPQKTHYDSITKANSLTLFRKLYIYIYIYNDNGAKHTNTVVSDQQCMFLGTLSRYQWTVALTSCSAFLSATLEL